MEVDDDVRRLTIALHTSPMSQEVKSEQAEIPYSSVAFGQIVGSCAGYGFLG